MAVVPLKSAPHHPACRNGDRRMPSQWLENNLDRGQLAQLAESCPSFPGTGTDPTGPVVFDKRGPGCGFATRD